VLNEARLREIAGAHVVLIELTWPICTHQQLIGKPFVWLWKARYQKTWEVLTCGKVPYRFRENSF
jgi:hypothetical protein